MIGGQSGVDRSGWLTNQLDRTHRQTLCLRLHLGVGVMATKIDRAVDRVLKTDEGKTLTELDYASRNRLLLLYIMLYMKQLVGVAKLSCFFLGVIAFILVVWYLFGWKWTGTITPSR
jgi:hypothetical protein